eukprot:m.162174 g.162174  ORF g.162174 m.162174 type:complete len:64 (-) comp14598_c0_seq1:2508-2699(-)
MSQGVEMISCHYAEGSLCTIDPPNRAMSCTHNGNLNLARRDISPVQKLASHPWLLSFVPGVSF